MNLMAHRRPLLSRYFKNKSVRYICLILNYQFSSSSSSSSFSSSCWCCCCCWCWLWCWTPLKIHVSNAEASPGVQAQAAALNRYMEDEGSASQGLSGRTHGLRNQRIDWCCHLRSKIIYLRGIIPRFFWGRVWCVAFLMLGGPCCMQHLSHATCRSATETRKQQGCRKKTNAHIKCPEVFVFMLTRVWTDIRWSLRNPGMGLSFYLCDTPEPDQKIPCFMGFMVT